MKVLVVEDNPRLSVRIKELLQKWFIVELTASGDETLRMVANNPYDLLILDLGLPDISGLELCTQIRRLHQDIPILVLTGVDTTASKVELLQAGADDYLTKPFELSELKARIDALNRRRKRSNAVALLSFGDLVIDPSCRKVTRAGMEVSLRKKEFDILEYLVRNAGRVLSREMIIHHAWPITSKSWTGSVDVHIKQLRDKVDRPFSYPIIKTSYGIGYTVELPKEVAAVNS